MGVTALRLNPALDALRESRTLTWTLTPPCYSPGRLRGGACSSRVRPQHGLAGPRDHWDVDHFILVGHGALPAAGVLDYDRRGQLLWAEPGSRAWSPPSTAGSTAARAEWAPASRPGGAVADRRPARPPLPRLGARGPRRVPPSHSFLQSSPSPSYRA